MFRKTASSTLNHTNLYQSSMAKTKMPFFITCFAMHILFVTSSTTNPWQSNGNVTTTSSVSIDKVTIVISENVTSVITSATSDNITRESSENVKNFFSKNVASTPSETVTNDTSENITSVPSENVKSVSSQNKTIVISENITSTLNESMTITDQMIPSTSKNIIKKTIITPKNRILEKDVSTPLAGRSQLTTRDPRNSVTSNPKDTRTISEGWENPRSTSDKEGFAKFGRKPTLNASRSFGLLNTGFISKQQYSDVSNIISIIVLPFLLLAIVFNIVNLTVFRRKQMKAPSRNFLVIFSIVQLIFIFLSSVVGILAIIFKEKATSSRTYLYYSNYVSVSVITPFRRSAFVINFIITLERFIVVSFPLKYRNFKITRYPKALSTFIITFCLIIHIPLSTKFKIEKYTVPFLQQTGYRMVPTKLFLENRELINALVTTLSVVVVYIPLITSLLLNIFIIIALKIHKKAQAKVKICKSSDRSRQAHQMTITLVASSLIFVLLSLPLNMTTLVSSLVPDYRLLGRQHYLFLLMFRVGFLCEVISNGTDFIFYLILSSKFRAVFVTVFCRKTPYKRFKSSLTNSYRLRMMTDSLPTISRMLELSLSFSFLPRPQSLGNLYTT